MRGLQRRRAATPHLVDRGQPSTRCRSSRPSSAMAYAAFADAPVDVAVVEVGMGGSWDATNVADADRRGGRCRSPSTTRSTSATARSTIAAREGRDHQARLDRRVRGQQAAGGRRGARRAGRRGRRDRARGRAWSSASSTGCPPSAARWSRCRACAATYDEVFLPLYGAHQAQNAAARAGRGRGVPRGQEPLDDELVRDGVRRGHLAGPARGRPAQPDDPARRRAQPARRRGARRGASRTRSRSTRSIGVVGVMARQGPRGRARRARAGARRTSSAPRTPPPRALPAEELAEVAARDLRRRPGVRRAAARGRHRPGRDARRGGRRVRRGDRLRRRARHRLGGHRRRGPARCSSREGTRRRDTARSARGDVRRRCSCLAGGRAVPHRRW